MIETEPKIQNAGKPQQLYRMRGVLLINAGSRLTTRLLGPCAAGSWSGGHANVAAGKIHLLITRTMTISWRSHGFASLVTS